MAILVLIGSPRLSACAVATLRSNSVHCHNHSAQYTAATTQLSTLPQLRELSQLTVDAHYLLSERLLLFALGTQQTLLQGCKFCHTNSDWSYAAQIDSTCTAENGALLLGARLLMHWLWVRAADRHLSRSIPDSTDQL